MTAGGGISLCLDCRRLPVYDGALRLAQSGVTCGGARNNRQAFQARVRIAPEVSDAYCELLFDPQTSGGLLVAIPREWSDAAVTALASDSVFVARVGEVTAPTDSPLHVVG
jgi:selenide,water dikinase